MAERFMQVGAVKVALLLVIVALLSPVQIAHSQTPVPSAEARAQSRVQLRSLTVQKLAHKNNRRKDAWQTKHRKTAAKAAPAKLAAETSTAKRNRVGGTPKALPSGATRAAPSGATPASPVARGPEELVSPKIIWRVENSFRFFKNADDTALHRATFAALGAEERKAPVLNSERALARRHKDGWAVAMAGNTCWDRKRNIHRCTSAADYINPKNHKVVVQLQNIADSTLVDCTWRAHPLARGGGRPRTVTLPCDTPATFAVPFPTGIQLSVAIGGQTVAERYIKVKDLFIVGMGDSFASGEGNPDTPVRFSRERSANYGRAKDGGKYAGYPARVGSWKQIGDKRFVRENATWLDQACHRSLYSHQLRAALQLAVEDTHRAITYIGLSCSGAETTYGLFLYYKGNEWVPNPPQYSQISAASQAQCAGRPAPVVDLPVAYHMRNKLPELNGLVLKKCNRRKARRIDLLFLSVGGNDVGFARLVANAVLSDASMLRKLGGWFGQVHGPKQARRALRLLDTRYKSLNRALHNILHIPWSESARIILTGYPGMATLGDGWSVCPDGTAGMSVVPEFYLSSRKAAQSEQVARQLNSIMKKAARRFHWSYVDAHRQAFLGRGICAGFAGDAMGVTDSLRLPRKKNGRWRPYNPANWRAYASRERWFRTPNDAYMTGHFHVQASLIQKALKIRSLAWFQLLLASTYSGAFHPTAEGQAAIADAVVVRARQVLKAYAAKDGVR